MIHMVKQLNATLIAAAAVARLLLVARRLIVRGAVAIVAGASDVAIGVVLAIALALAGDHVLSRRRHPRCQCLRHLRHSRRRCPLRQRGRPLRQRGRISLTLWRVVDSHLLNVQRRRRSTEFCTIIRLAALTDDFGGTSRELDGTGFDATCGGRGNGLA